MRNTNANVNANSNGMFSLFLSIAPIFLFRSPQNPHFDRRKKRTIRKWGEVVKSGLSLCETKAPKSQDIWKEMTATCQQHMINFFIVFWNSFNTDKYILSARICSILHLICCLHLCEWVCVCIPRSRWPHSSKYVSQLCHSSWITHRLHTQRWSVCSTFRKLLYSYELEMLYKPAMYIMETEREMKRATEREMVCAKFIDAALHHSHWRERERAKREREKYIWFHSNFMQTGNPLCMCSACNVALQQQNRSHITYTPNLYW